MPNYGNDSSEDDSGDEIGFPKTPGQPLAVHHSDDNSDNESNKSSSASSDSESEQSDNDIVRQKSDSDNDDARGKKSPDSDHNNKSSESSDSDSNDEIVKPVPSNSNSPVEKSNENNADNRDSSASSSDDDDEGDRNKKASSDSENEANTFTRDRKRKALDSSDDSDGDNGDKGKNTTAKDLFGDLSDEEDENKSDQEDRNDVRKRARIEEDDDEEVPQVEKNVINDIFGDDDENEQEDREEPDERDRENIMDEDEEAPLPERRIEVEIPRIMSNLGNGLHFVKLPNFLSIDTHPYDPLTYEDEIDEDEVHDDEGRARLKLKVENTLRWRNVVHEDGTSTKESNSRVVKWSDGSMSLLLGDEIFDIQTLNLLAGENNHLYVRQGTGLQGQAVFRTKLTFRPFSTESFTHRKLTLSLADRSQKTQKICVLPSVGKDPEAHRSEMIKKEESKLKASILKESKQKRVKDRFYGRGPNSAYLENDEDDDESISISKIKNQYKRGTAASGGAQFSGDESESDQSDDDSEEDIFEKKKSTEKKKIVESDDDED